MQLIWTGRSYDLGKMSLRDLIVAFSTYYAIQAYVVLALLSGAVAVYTAGGWVPPVLGAATALIVYPFAWYLIHRYILHSRMLYKSAWTAATWKRLHLLHHFHKENGNYGIVSFGPDRLFHTCYDSVRETPRSATVFNLGYDRAKAASYPWVADLTGTLPLDRPPAAYEAEAGQVAEAEFQVFRGRARK